MASFSYTYTLTNGTTADADQVMQNFNDVRNGITDGTKDISVNALTVAGTAALNGNITLGNSTADDLTISANLASSIPIKATNSYSIGSSTLGLASIYFGANDQTTRIVASPSASATWTLTLPRNAGSANEVLTNSGSGATDWAQITNDHIASGAGISGSKLANGLGTKSFSSIDVNKISGQTSTGSVNAGGAAGTPSYVSYITSTSSRKHIVFENDSPTGVEVGSISTSGSSTSYSTSSDYRLKEDFTAVTGALAKIRFLPIYDFAWKINKERMIGFLAHEVASIAPFAVTGAKDAVTDQGVIIPQSVDYAKLVPLVIAAIQEIAAKIDSLLEQPAS